MPETMDTTDALTEIDALLKTATTEAANALQEIAEKSDSKGTKKAAKRALYLLSQKGIAPSEKRAVLAFLPKNAAPEIQRFLMSNIDGAGNQMLWFILPDAYGGRPSLLSVLWSDEVGVKDWFATKTTRDDLDERIGDYEFKSGGLFADAEPDYGRWLVAQARAINRAQFTVTPPGFLDYLPRIGEPQKQYDAPPLEEMPTAETLEADETFPREADALFAHPFFEMWFLGMDVVFPELAQWIKTMAEKSEAGPDEMLSLQKGMIESITEKVLTPEMQAQSVNRLLLNALVLWKNDEETPAKQCLYHAHKMQTDIIHSEFANTLVGRTLAAAREMLVSSMQARDAENGIIEAE